jgi:hypothetical protein
MNLSEAKSTLRATHMAAVAGGYRASAIMLESGPGVGKSDSIEQLCADLAREYNEPVGLLTFMIATISSVDIRGFMLPTKTDNGLESVFSTPPWYPTTSNVDVVTPDGVWHPAGTWEGPVPRIGQLFLDEFGQGEDDVKKAAAELLYRGRVGSTTLPLGWRVVGAQNRMSDRSGVLRELMFLVNRRCLLSIQPAVETWIDWANAQAPHVRPHPMTISFARKEAGIVFRNEVPQGSEPFCTPRTLCLMDRELKALRTPAEVAKDAMPTSNVARELVSGWIGDGAGAQYFVHLKYAEEIPDIADIVKDYTKAKCPANRDAQMVTGYFLAHHVDDKNADAILKYINRLQTDMQVLTVRTITAQQEKAQTLTSNALFAQWLIRNKDILVASRG